MAESRGGSSSGYIWLSLGGGSSSGYILLSLVVASVVDIYG